MKFRRSPDVVARSIDQEAVLLDLASGRYFGLNATGAAIWDALEGGEADPESIARDIASRFSAPEEQILADVRALLADLVQQNLVLGQ